MPIHLNSPGPIIQGFGGAIPQIDDSVFLAPGAAVIGDVTIGPESSVWYNCVIRGDDHFIRIGARTNIQDGTVIHVTIETHPTIIGDDVIVGHGARLHGCTLHENCLIGISATVLDGAEVGEQAMLAAGSLLPPHKKVPPGELWGGIPARKMRDLTDDDRAFLQFDAAHYVKLAARYRAG